MDQLRKVFNGQEADGGESGLMSEVILSLVIYNIN